MHQNIDDSSATKQPDGYMVFVGSNGQPFISRMFLVYTSPKRRSFHYRAVNCAGDQIVKCSVGNRPSRSAGDAVRWFQWNHLACAQLKWRLDYDQRLDQILAAERCLSNGDTP